MITTILQLVIIAAVTDEASDKVIKEFKKYMKRRMENE